MESEVRLRACNLERCNFDYAKRTNEKPTVCFVVIHVQKCPDMFICQISRLTRTSGNIDASNPNFSH